MGDNPNANIRISDVERDLAMAALGEHLGTGRLELDEYDDRSTRVIEARTRADLEALFTDLPEPHPDLSAAVPPPGRAVTIRKAKKNAVTVTPAGKAMEAVAGLTIVLGIPSAIVLTILAGLWWLFFPVVGVFLVAAAVAEALKKPTDNT
jgi:hypothetical protein